MCVREKQEHIPIFFPQLINFYCSCRKLRVDQHVSTRVLVPRRRWERGHIAGFFQTEERHGRREGVAGVDGQ